MKFVHETRKLIELIKIREEIHLNPSWQRGPVWSITKQALLVDSILRGYDIPMIYLLECAPNTQFKFEVVDGQQRLRSLWNFIDGEFSLPKEFEKIGQVEIGGKEYYDLPKSFRNRITNFIVVVAIVKDAREPEVSQLFSRMQMGVRLNPAELRNAIQTGLRHAIDGMARLHTFFHNSRIPVSRYKHQDFLAHAFSICFHDANRDLKAQQLRDDYTHVIDDDLYIPILATADDILGFLNEVNIITSLRIKQKWVFVDLFYILYKNAKKIKILKPNDFAEVYIEFDQSRLEYNAEPEELLSGNPTREQKDLYDYILAFKLSGGERKNLKQRYRVIRRRFKTVLEV